MNAISPRRKPENGPVETDKFLEAMSSASTSVNIVTTDGSAGRAGVTISAMCPVSADHPTVLVCVHHLSPAAKLIEENGVFCVNLLTTEQSNISDIFAGRLERNGGDKFSCAEWISMATGSPGLVGALASFDCTVVQKMRWDTHYVYLGEVVDIERVGDDALPLIYGYRSYGSPSLQNHAN
jgi:flavin reductase (DIM6/NTAB) family NADH-FMN oxidoreductase RutF